MKTNDSPFVASLWKQWMDEASQSAANELIQHYMYLVHFYVERINSQLPDTIDKSDLTSFGMTGLYDAMVKFQHKRGLQFATYASHRIRGAIMDGLRQEDWLSRSMRQRAKKVEQASQELRQTYQREPTSEEIAEMLQLTAEDVEESVQYALTANILSIEENPNDDDDKEGIGYAIPDHDAVQPDQSMLQAELENELIDSLGSLNHNEQMVISLFYHQELTLTEIGEVLELTTSRISQIHRKAIFKLRQSLQKIQNKA